MSKFKKEIDGVRYTVDTDVETYLYRGLMGSIFSRGLDKYNDKALAGMGNVLPFGAAREITKDLIRRSKKAGTPTSIFVGGHSLGAAEALRQCNEIAKKSDIVVLGCLLLDYVPRGCRLWYKPEVQADFPCIHWHTSDPRVKLVKGANNRHVDLTHIQLDDDLAVHREMSLFMHVNYKQHQDNQNEQRNED